MIVAVDFDGTVVDNHWPKVGEEAPGAVDALLLLSNAGHRIVLWTCRCEAALEDAVAWFEERGIQLAGVNDVPGRQGPSPKLSADVYIDDKGLGVPLITLYGFRGPVVDWARVPELLRQVPAAAWEPLREQE